MENEPDKLSAYQKNKDSYNRWRVKNQAHINKYYRNKRAELKTQQQEEHDKQIIEKYLMTLKK